MARRLFPGPLSLEQVRLMHDAAIRLRSETADPLTRQRWDVIIHAMTRALEHGSKASEKALP